MGWRGEASAPPPPTQEQLAAQHRAWGAALLSGAAATRAPLALRRLLAGGDPVAHPPAVAAVGPGPLVAPQGPVGEGEFAPQPAVLMGVKVENVPEPGVTVIRTQLQYIVSTSVLLQAVRAKGVNIVSISLRSFQPNWSTASGTDDPAAAAPSSANAGDTGKIVAAAVVPAAAALAVVIALAAWMMQHMRRRKQELAAARKMRESRSSGSWQNGGPNGPPRGDSGLPGGDSTAISTIVEQMRSGNSGAHSAQESLMLPGLGSDWEIDPANIAILRRPDGSEWELGSGASGRVSPSCHAPSPVLL